MAQITDFTIEQIETGYVVKGLGFYQDIDNINGGYILTEQRAIEIRDLLINSINNPVLPQPTAEERLALLEQAMNDMLLGGI